jgi:hypothetical protein
MGKLSLPLADTVAAAVQDKASAGLVVGLLGATARLVQPTVANRTLGGLLSLLWSRAWGWWGVDSLGNII